MAVTSNSEIRGSILDQAEQFLQNYYRDDLAVLATEYPKDRQHLTVDWGDLYQFDPDLADDYLTDPERIDAHLLEAVGNIPLPVDVDLADIDIRMVGLHDGDVYRPADVPKLDEPGYIGVRGDLSKVTAPTDEISTAAFECLRCGVLTHIPQSTDKIQEPHECSACERQGPFTVDFDESTFQSFCKVRIATPPDESGDLTHTAIDGFVRGDLVWSGHEEWGLFARSGDSVTVYGEVVRQPKTDKSRQFESFIDVQAIEFDGDGDGVDIETNREAFEELAASPDPVDLLAQSLAPDLYATPAWETALELLVAYLFGAPRISIPGGTTFRGDIHALIISDYGMGKSMVNEAIATYSPNCIKESVTGMSSEVGLLAAAVKDDFGDGQWTLEPGILVRANGGHVILDEIDKTDVNLERMNDALEGEQVITVNKAGQHATYKSRVGLLATGNPEEARFNAHDAISDQLDIDQSLLSRFDGIVTMSDHPDMDMDANIAETQGLSVLEAQEYAFGDREEFDVLDRPVSPEVGRAWIAYARENVRPLIDREHVEAIKTWYAEEVRQLNHDFAGDGDGSDMPVPVTARVVKATIRFAIAFARVHLRERVTDADVERAMDLSKRLVGQNFDGEKFHPHETRPPQNQDERVSTVIGIINDHDGIEREAVLDIAEEQGMDREKAGHVIEKLKRNGRIYNPEGEVLRVP